MKEILVVRDIEKNFKTKSKSWGPEFKNVLDGVSFELYENETIAIVGENGAGKTVLLNTIFNILEKDSGEVYLDLGKGTFNENLSEIGFQFQEQPFTQSIKLKDIIDEYSVIYSDRVDEKKINEMLEVFGLSNLLNKKTNVFSGGQKQRVNLFLAMMTNPKLMILDEFITGLDINSVEDILDYIQKHKKENKSSMIIISHQPEEIERLADRILILKNGKIEEQTTPKDVLSKYSSMTEFLMEVI